MKPLTESSEFRRRLIFAFDFGEDSEGGARKSRLSIDITGAAYCELYQAQRKVIDYRLSTHIPDYQLFISAGSDVLADASVSMGGDPFVKAKDGQILVGGTSKETFVYDICNLINTILGRRLLEQQLLVVGASATTIRDSVVMIVGPSGWGKTSRLMGRFR